MVVVVAADADVIDLLQWVYVTKNVGRCSLAHFGWGSCMMPEKNVLSRRIMLKLRYGKVYHAPQDSAGGCSLPPLGLEPVGGEQLLSVTCAQCDARRLTSQPQGITARAGLRHRPTRPWSRAQRF